MKPFKFYRASNAEEALNAVKDESRYLGGGTNLVDLMKHHIEQPDQLIDVNYATKDSITESSEGISIGAAVKNSDLAAHPIILEKYPLISQAVLKGASPQIRNMATTAGNILQRTRCPYFYNSDLPCNKRKPGSGCGALLGNHKLGAIIGHSELCVATHPSDLCVALTALDAVVKIVQPNGNEMEISMIDFHRLPGDQPQKDNILPENSLITEIFIPKNNYQYYTVYEKIRDRTEYAFALVSVAAALDINSNGPIKSARLASGGVAHKPWRWLEAEEFLKNKEPNENTFLQAADLIVDKTQPLPQNTYKKDLLHAAVRTALLIAVNGSKHE